MNISGIRPYNGFYENRIQNNHEAVQKAAEQQNIEKPQTAAKENPADTGVVYESKRPEALDRALTEMKEDRVLQQYQFFAKGLSGYDPSLAVISGENFNI